MALTSPHFTTQVDPDTARRLELAARNAPPLGPGERHREAVATLQIALMAYDEYQFMNGWHKRYTYAPAMGATGNYDHDMVRAVKNFQRAFRLQIDGIAGRHTLGTLDDLFNSGPWLVPTGPSTGSLSVVPGGPGPHLLVDQPDDRSKQDLDTSRTAFARLNLVRKAKVLSMRALMNAVLEGLMLTELGLGGGPLGPGGPEGIGLATTFFNNSTAGLVISRPPADNLSKMVAASSEFVSEARGFEAKLDQELKRQAAAGTIDFTSFPGGSPPPPAPKIAAPNVSYSGIQPLHVLIGAFQGSKVSINDFTVPPVGSSYSATLIYELTDHFGVDDSDLDPLPIGHGSPGQIAFWTLQHERRPGHIAFVLQVTVERAISGTL
jgi:hypothetical protein